MSQQTIRHRQTVITDIQGVGDSTVTADGATIADAALRIPGIVVAGHSRP